MSVREIDRNEWRTYFDALSRRLGEKKVDIIVTASTLGAQIEAERLPLLGLTYDSHDDVFTIVAEHIEHAIPGPKRILVDEKSDGFSSIEIVGADDSKQIISVEPAS